MIKPLGDRIFLKKDKPIEKIGNIIIPKDIFLIKSIARKLFKAILSKRIK